MGTLGTHGTPYLLPNGFDRADDALRSEAARCRGDERAILNRRCVDRDLRPPAPNWTAHMRSLRVGRPKRSGAKQRWVSHTAWSNTTSDATRNSIRLARAAHLVRTRPQHLMDVLESPKPATDTERHVHALRDRFSAIRVPVSAGLSGPAATWNDLLGARGA